MPQDKNIKSDNHSFHKAANPAYIKSVDRKALRRRKNRSRMLYSDSESVYMLDMNKASDNDRKAFRNLTEKGVLPADFEDKINIGLKNERGKHMIVNPALEKKRILLRKLDFACIAVMIAAVFAATAFASINIILDSDTADKLFIGKINPRISDDGNYIFGEFNDYVTVGDTLETAFKILGLPDSYNAKNNLYYYGYSYIIIDNDIVVGYYHDNSEEFHVTVGYKNPDISPEIGIGDSAARVVKKLGSPEYYLKHRWIYENMNKNFEKSSYSNACELIINFNDNYTVSGYEFISR